MFFLIFFFPNKFWIRVMVDLKNLSEEALHKAVILWLSCLPTGSPKVSSCF